jgi:hypothetical protein
MIRKIILFESAVEMGLAEIGDCGGDFVKSSVATGKGKTES